MQLFSETTSDSVVSCETCGESEEAWHCHTPGPIRVLITIPDRRFHNWTLRRDTFKMIPSAIGFVLLVRGLGPRWNLEIVVGMAMFVLGILHWAWQDRRLLRSYHCPDCGRHLPKPNPLPMSLSGLDTEKPIIFQCSNCGIEWDTVLRR